MSENSESTEAAKKVAATLSYHTGEKIASDDPVVGMTILLAKEQTARLNEHQSSMQGLINEHHKSTVEVLKNLAAAFDNEEKQFAENWWDYLPLINAFFNALIIILLIILMF